MARSPSGGDPRRKKFLKDFLRQDNARGMGLARDVKAGRARVVPASYTRRAKKRG
jgi:hypothetical protein